MQVIIRPADKMRTFPIPGTYKSARVAVPANRKPEARLDDGGLFQAKRLEEMSHHRRRAALRDQLRCLSWPDLQTRVSALLRRHGGWDGDVHVCMMGFLGCVGVVALDWLRAASLGWPVGSEKCVLPVFRGFTCSCM
jgi:hypothetical protein